MTYGQKKDFERLFKAGLRWDSGDGNYIKLMAVCDGYVMARNKGCVPFVETYEDFKKRVTDRIIN